MEAPVHSGSGASLIRITLVESRDIKQVKANVAAVSLLSFYRMNLETIRVKLVDTAKLMSAMIIQPILFISRYRIL